MKIRKKAALKIGAVIMAAAVCAAYIPAASVSVHAGDTKSKAEVTAEGRANGDPLAGTGAYASDASGSSSSAFSSKTTSSITSQSVSTPTKPSRFAGYKTYCGPDISYHNSPSSTALSQSQWNKIKSAGYKFAIIRVAYRSVSSAGALHTDGAYSLNIQRAHAAGLKVGVYIYSQALSTKEAKAEANYLIKLIEPYRTYINMPVVMDYEYYSTDSYTGRLTGSKPSKATKTKAVLQFFKTVKAAGYSPMLYASRSFLVNSLKMSSIEGKGDIWLAEWKTSATTYTGDYSFWQWTDEGGIKGIKGNVDLNTWYTKDIDKYNRYYTGTVPTGLAQSSRDLTSNTMSWNKTTNAESYTLYRADTYPGTFKSVGTTASTSYKNTGLTSGREYYYKLTATGTAASDLTTVSKTSSKTSGYVRGYTKPGYTRTAKVKRAASICSRPNTTEKVKAAKGAKLRVYCWTKDGDNATWYRVKYVKGNDSYYGYIKGTNVSITKTGRATDKINVRSGAGTSYKTITTIASGTKVTIKATRKDKSGGIWYKVKFTKSSKTYTGYVSASYIK